MALTKISGSILKDPLNLGEVSIGGTLTYQDVTNVDSVGVITARSGIKDQTLTAGRVVYVDSDKTLTDSANLVFDGIRLGIGDTPTTQFTSHSILQVGGQCTLGANDALSATGQTYLTHNLYFDTGGTLKVFNTSNANEGAIFRLVDGNLLFSNSSATTGTPTVTEKFRITSAGRVGIDRTSPSTMLDIKVPPLNTATITTTNCLQLGMLLTSGATGSNTEGHIYNGLAVGDGYAGLYGKDGGSSAATDLEFFTGTASAVAGRMRIQDDGKIIMGGNVSQSINRNISIVAPTGNSQDVQIGFQPTNSSGGYNPEIFVGATADGTYGAAMYFYTRDTSGTRAERLRIKSDGNIQLNNTHQKIHMDTSDGSDNHFLNLGGGGDCTQTRGAQLVLFGNEYSSHQGKAQILCGNSGNANGIFQVYTGGAERFIIDADGHVLPGVNDTYDLGSSSKKWRNIYTTDLQLSNEGKTNDVDGTWGNYTIQEGESDLFLINNRSGKKYKFNLTEVS